MLVIADQLKKYATPNYLMSFKKASVSAEAPIIFLFVFPSPALPGSGRSGIISDPDTYIGSPQKEKYTYDDNS
jgi:hypothetical protein